METHGSFLTESTSGKDGFIQNCWDHSHLGGPYHKKTYACVCKAPGPNHSENILGYIILHSINGQLTGFCLISMTRKITRMDEESQCSYPT